MILFLTLFPFSGSFALSPFVRYNGFKRQEKKLCLGVGAGYPILVEWVRACV